MSQKLKALLTAKVSTFGSTDTGGDWCLKALHPADPIVSVAGIPDRSALPTAFLNYCSQATVGPNSEDGGAWSFDATLLPDPIAFLWGVRHQGALDESFHVLNSQIAGSTFLGKMQSWNGTAERWRLAYAGVTVHQNGPTLSDQGMISVAQVPVKARMLNVGGQYTADPPGFTSAHIMAFDENDLPDFNKNAAYPNAYMGESREGVYVPLKLGPKAFEWVGIGDCCMLTDVISQAASANAWHGLRNLPAVSNQFPYGSSLDVGASPAFAAMEDMQPPTGTLTPPFSNELVAHICARNISPSTSFTMYFRYGFEVQCQATSVLAPLVKLSPKYDEVALSTYAMITRELKDAYPADFNDLGKMWDVVSSVAKTLAPAASFIPGVGPLISSAIPMATNLGDAIRNASRGEATGSASAGQVEAVRDAISAARAVQRAAAPVARNAIAKARKAIGHKSKRQ